MTIVGNLGFVGAGNMASAIVGGLLEAGAASKSQLGVYDPDSARTDAQAQLGVSVFSSNVELAAWADTIVLATKPQIIDTVLEQLAPHVAGKLLISIAAGVSCARIESFVPVDTRVIRTMPNTPALIRSAATAIAAGRHATDEDTQLAQHIFESVGIVVHVDEKQIDAVTGLSGSGPAYVFAMVEALAEAGQAVGLHPEVALQLTTQTVLGAAYLLKTSGESPETLRKRVSSPGGTTVAGLAALERAGFKEALIDAVKTATARSVELGSVANDDQTDPD